jgi:hypothetical protein
MLTLCTLLPSDNQALLGRSNGFYEPLLIPSDNVEASLERSNAAHYIECASRSVVLFHYCMHTVILYHYCIYPVILYKTTVILEKMGVSIRMCDPPPTQKFRPSFFYKGDLQICHRLN